MHNLSIRHFPFSLLTLALLVIGCKKDCASSERCQLKPDAGPCYAAFTKYYYDQTEKRCKQFTYGGCGGTVPFDTMEQCKECECRN
ncbi:BPTI/Kunitz domain-containing protein [Spirosoma terrae]|uniref:Proteinase inhibitor I4 serpin n=1 Tax=Spirosoma terrae TaxID=1968276 RepID=A0A6L9LB04_9BACT|nr:BPTI/Kunitz domain-containing protein [Spirosoma terrae]NDU95993.1 proteinase inhibitor I4 serpin [Spirosoma terrae]